MKSPEKLPMMKLLLQVDMKRWGLGVQILHIFKGDKSTLCD